MLRIIGQQNVPLEKLSQKLAEVAEQYKSAMELLKALDPQDLVARDLVVRADAAFTAGRLDEADQLVSQAEQAEIAASHQVQQLTQQAVALTDQRLLRAAHDARTSRSWLPSVRERTNSARSTSSSTLMASSRSRTTT